MALINLNNLLSGASSGGTWSTTSLCGHVATNPDAIDLTDPTSVDFTGKTPGTYTFYYSVDSIGCTPDCETVTVIAASCCDVTIDSITNTISCPSTLTITYTVGLVTTGLAVNIIDQFNNVRYSSSLNAAMSDIGTHTLILENVPCSKFNSQNWTVSICCTTLA